jgi:hypothetical protein
MSLEETLAANTAALHALTAALVAAGALPKPAAVPAVVSGPATAKAAAPLKTVAESAPTADTAASPAPASTAATPDPKPAAASPQKETAAASPAAEAGATSYDQVKALILKLSKEKGGDAARAVLAAFGVTKGPELKAAQYAEVVTHCEAALA